MRYDADALMDLLPAVYHVSDADGSLRALMGVLAEQIGIVEDDLDALYADGFIETCALWVVPYLGDLIGFVPLSGETSRAEVANTLGYRRRKGTAGVLDGLAQDVTGAAAVAVEYFQTLATTAHLAHPRPKHPRTASLRDLRALGRIGTAFDRLPRTAEARRIGPRHGRYNIPNVGVVLYRDRILSVSGGDPFRVADGVYAFHPLGLDVPLFRPAETKSRPDSRTTEANVPLNVRRRTLEHDLDDHRQRLADLQPSSLALPFRITLNGADVLPESIVVTELGPGAARFPADAARTLRRTNSDTTTDYPIVVAVDPVRGGFVLREDVAAESLSVGYAYAQPAPIGGGSYDRIVVGAPTASAGAGSLAAVLNSLNGGPGVVEVADSRTTAAAPVLKIDGADDDRLRVVVRAAPGERPTFADGFAIDGTGEAVLEGLLIDAGVKVTGDIALTLRDCTVIGSLQSDGDVSLERCVVGALNVASLAALDSVLMGDVKAETLTFEGVTALGDVATGEIDEVSDSLVVGALVADRLGIGCVRFSHLGPGSAVPKPHRCTEPPTLPVFVSMSLTHPGFARLHAFCPPAIAQGADDRGEMGAYHLLQEPRKEANLRLRLDEYLRLGLEAGIERADENETLR